MRFQGIGVVIVILTVIMIYKIKKFEKTLSRVPGEGQGGKNKGTQQVDILRVS